MAYYPQPKRDAFNALIGLSDRRLGRYIKHVFENEIKEQDYFKSYKKCMKSYDLPHYSKYIYTKKSQEQLLPWECVKVLKN